MRKLILFIIIIINLRCSNQNNSNYEYKNIVNQLRKEQIDLNKYKFIYGNDVNDYFEGFTITNSMDSLKIVNNSIVNENNEKYAIIHQINRCNLEFMLGLVE